MYFRKPSHYVSVRSLHLDTSHYYDKLKDPDYLSHLANGKYRQKKTVAAAFLFHLKLWQFPFKYCNTMIFNCNVVYLD